MLNKNLCVVILVDDHYCRVEFFPSIKVSNLIIPYQQKRKYCNSATYADNHDFQQSTLQSKSRRNEPYCSDGIYSAEQGTTNYK